MAKLNFFKSVKLIQKGTECGQLMWSLAVLYFFSLGYSCDFDQANQHSCEKWNRPVASDGKLGFVRLKATGKLSKKSSNFREDSDTNNNNLLRPDSDADSNFDGNFFSF